MLFCSLCDTTLAAATTTAAVILMIPLIHEESWWLFPSFRRDNSLLERVPSFVLNRKTEEDGAPKSCFLCQRLGLFSSKLDGLSE